MNLRDLNQKFKVRLIWIQMIGKVVTLSSSFPLKYDLLLEPYNSVSRRTQWLVMKELEVVKLFSFWNLETLKLKILPK